MSFLQDLRYAARLLVKDKWFTLVAATALALGIAVNTAVFTFVNAVLIRGLPFDEPDRIIAVGTTDARNRQLGMSRLDFVDMTEASHSFAGLALMQPASINISEEGRAPERFQGQYQSANLFKVIGARPIVGRDFLLEDDNAGSAPVVVLGNGLWKNRYGSDPSIIGRVIKVNSLSATIVGVMAPDMKFAFNSDLWVSLSAMPPETRNAKRDVRNFQVVGRLAPGVSLAQARAELQTIFQHLTREYQATNKDMRASVMTFNERVTGPQIRLMFLSLMGAVAFVLLIACANVANLLLARAAQRSREIAVRVSLGASRWRIVRQLLVESVLLSVVSGVFGLGLSIVGIRMFDVVTSDVGKPYWMTFTLDNIVFAYLAAICVGTGLLFGLAPALHVTRTDVHEVLKEGGGRSGSGGMRARRWTGALIVVEVMLTLVLLAGAGFMMRSFLTLYQTNLGIDTSHLLTMRMNLPLSKYSKPELRTLLYQRLEERLRHAGALQAGAVTSHAPMSFGFLRQLSIDGRPTPAGEKPPDVTMVSASAGYFDTLGVRVLRGRSFSDVDGTPGHEAAIVNQRFATMHFAGEDAIGRRIRLTDSSPQAVPPPPVDAVIVGIVPTVRQRNFQDPDPDPVVYLPYRADPPLFATLVVRAAGDPTQITTVVREEMRVIEPDLPLFNILTMDQFLAQQRWSFRVFGSMFAIFAAIALLLSAVGLYAVTAYSVTQRTAELGVRMALGAQPGQVMWLVLRRALVQLAIGLPLGLAGAFGVGRLLQTLLVQTSSHDLVTIGSIAGLMIVVSLLACLWPARRATRLDPVSALRYE